MATRNNERRKTPGEGSKEFLAFNMPIDSKSFAFRLQRSLSVWLPKMAIEEGQQATFLVDILSLVFSFWREHDSVAADTAPEQDRDRSKLKSKGGTR